MKKIIILAFSLSAFFVHSQKKNDTLSITFEHKPRVEVLNEIEKVTGFEFYYIESWFDQTLISGNYKAISIEDLLDNLLDKTPINYFILDDKIILTKNSVIYDQLPPVFDATNRTVDSTYDNSKPILFTENVSNESNKIETVRIGKESRNVIKKYYQLSGFVINNDTKEPIPNLALVVRNSNINAITNDQGFYTIQLPSGINYLETKALGIQGAIKKIIIYNDGVLNFNLKESSETLKEVTIESEKDKNIKQAITGVTQIKIEEIKNIPLILGERDLLKVATKLPGIKTAGEGSTGYNVRGGKEDQNLILLDNAIIYNPTHFFGIFSALNPFSIGYVNIYKGDIPVEFGGRLSSVFDIKTKNINTEKTVGEVSVGPVTGNISVEIPIVKNKAGLLLGSRGAYSNWILKSLDEESLKNSQASFYDGIIKYSHDINEKNTIETTGYYSKDNFSITSDSTYSYSNRLATLKWDHSFNDKNKASISLANSEYRFNIEYDGNTNNDFNLGYRLNETEFKIKIRNLNNQKHKLDYGFSSKLYNVDPGYKKPLNAESIVENFNIAQEKALESGLFLADEFQVNEKLTLNLGVRYSSYSFLGPSTQKVYKENLPKNEGTVIDTLYFKNNKFIKTYGGPELRTSFRLFLSQSLSIKGGYNSVYQYIHTLSNNTTVSPTDTWKLSDLNLKPQHANQFSLGIYKNFDGNTYEVSLEGYYKKLKNIVDYKVGAYLLLNKYIETEVIQGIGKAYGIEFLVKKTRGNLNGWLGYSYSRSLYKLDSDFNEERVNNGDFFPSNFDKPHNVDLVLNYKITKRFSFSGNFSYQSGRPITYPVGNYVYNGAEYVLYSDRNKFRIPDYYRLDLGFNIEGNHKIKKFVHSFWNISVYNLLGRNNPYSVFFVTKEGEIKAYKTSIFSVPIPTITYNFKF